MRPSAPATSKRKRNNASSEDRKNAKSHKTTQSAEPDPPVQPKPSQRPYELDEGQLDLDRKLSDDDHRLETAAPEPATCVGGHTPLYTIPFPPVQSARRLLFTEDQLTPVDEKAYREANVNNELLRANVPNYFSNINLNEISIEAVQRNGSTYHNLVYNGEAFTFQSPFAVVGFGIDRKFGNYDPAAVAEAERTKKKSYKKDDITKAAYQFSMGCMPVSHGMSNAYKQDVEFMKFCK